jgi:hypothetical protein
VPSRSGWGPCKHLKLVGGCDQALAALLAHRNDGVPPLSLAGALHAPAAAQICEQEVQLAASAKLTQDLKAALLLVCGVLKQTSFVQPDVSRQPPPTAALALGPAAAPLLPHTMTADDGVCLLAPALLPAPCC